MGDHISVKHFKRLNAQEVQEWKLLKPELWAVVEHITHGCPYDAGLQQDILTLVLTVCPDCLENFIPCKCMADE